MTTPSALNDVHVPTPEYSGAEFAISADGFPVAQVGDLIFAMLPARDGACSLASAWRLKRPLTETRRDDFYSLHGPISDEAAFRARVLELAEHSRELSVLNRKIQRISCHTPWGPSQGATVYADGVVAHTTASHGGFRLSAERNAKIHPMLKSENGFYEEDEAWAAVAISFLELFTSYERRCAEKTLKDWEPDAWEAISGTVLGPGESYVKDRRAFEREHADDRIVISALRWDHHTGMTEVIATRGGQRDAHAEERRFLVLSSEYEVGRFGFVIDEARHAHYDGPSSFVSWRGRNEA